MAGRISITIAGDMAYSNSEAAISLQSAKFLGEFKNGRVYYNSVEVLYLVEKYGAEALKGEKGADYDSLIRMFSRKDREVFVRYSAFRDLRDRGYVVKAALKFGGDFRVYKKGETPGNAHSNWILYPISEKGSIKMHEFSSKVRVAHSTHKNLLIAVVDGEGDVTYYVVSWLKP